jgi:ATP-dependent Clp protease protease subunit
MTNKQNSQSKENQPLRGERHILFKRQIPKIRIDVPIVNEYTLYLSDIDEKQIALASILNEFRGIDPDSNIKLVINSSGGFISEGKAIINTLKKTGADIETELIANAYSMAALIFCIGDRRVVYENSSIMFHNYSHGSYGKGQEVVDHVKYISKNNKAFFKAIVVGMEDHEIEEMFAGKDFWFSTKEMCKRGIATHVIVEDLKIPAKEYLHALKVVKKAAKKKGYHIETIAEGLLYGFDVLSPIAEKQEKEMQQISESITELVNTHEFLYN